MITYRTGNLLEAEVEALVNTVNTVGVMGKGIALQFKEIFQENFRDYLKAAKTGEITIGKVFVTQTQTTNGVKYIINFPTKTDWRLPSRIDYISKGLENLKAVIESLNIRSIALPPLGCGNGGLKWDLVKKEIEEKLSEINADIIVFSPNERIQEILEKENRKEVKLTSPRVMLIYLLYQYTALGESISEFASEKLMYFLQRFGETQLKLDFKNSHYGPYSGKVRHVLYALNGKYILGYDQKQSRPFEPIKLNISEAKKIKTLVKDLLTVTEQERLNRVVQFIQGFQTPYALELLSTVDSIIKENNSFDMNEIKMRLAQWSTRKKNLFTDKHIEIATEHLKKQGEILYC